MQTRPMAWNNLNVSACLNGLAKLQYEGVAKVQAAAIQLLPQLLPSAEARHISNSVWSLCKRQQVLGCDVVDALSVRFLEVLPQATPQEVAMLLFGLARMHTAPSKQLLDGCAEHVASVVERCNAQDIANIIWALGELGHCPSASTMQTLLQVDALQVCMRSSVCCTHTLCALI